ncbi:uncharacterized protein LOC113931941 [Zalophus californianus]|uniref:Uncharacterized protein LOC113931941 n=1 Tax=Zalophus californianus TaxID=9704 RepID=A0A6J2EGK0_ZALCA|nr:uncharacterized protein LOC113931941 [Zalophus californianus]
MAPPPPGPGRRASARLGDGGARSYSSVKAKADHLQVTSAEMTFPAIDLKGERKVTRFSRRLENDRGQRKWGINTLKTGSRSLQIRWFLSDYTQCWLSGDSLLVY